VRSAHREIRARFIDEDQASGIDAFHPAEERRPLRRDVESVSNSLSGRDRQLDELPAVGDPAHMAQVGRRYRVFINEGQRRVAVQ
jgi:hypothetical protein